MRYYKNGSNLIATKGVVSGIEITKEEYETAFAATKAKSEMLAKISEKSRPLTESEVLALLIPQQINTLLIDDNTALRMTSFYPEWAEGVEYTVGYKVQRNSKLWRVILAHTSVIGWEPENAATLFEQINETHTGTLEDPIPYEGNMALENGKYYMQDYVIYLCNRDTINPVYNPLSELIGLYVVLV